MKVKTAFFLLIVAVYGCRRYLMLQQVTYSFKATSVNLTLSEFSVAFNWIIFWKSPEKIINVLKNNGLHCPTEAFRDSFMQLGCFNWYPKFAELVKNWKSSILTSLSEVEFVIRSVTVQKGPCYKQCHICIKRIGNVL